MSDSRYEEYYKIEDIKCRLLAEGKCNKTMITFLKNNYSEERYNNYLAEFKGNRNIHKIVKIENGVEEVLLERMTTICSA